jgi:hypothetical protein
MSVMRLLQTKLLGSICKPVLIATELAVADPANPGPATVRDTGRLCYPSGSRAAYALAQMVKLLQLSSICFVMNDNNLEDSTSIEACQAQSKVGSPRVVFTLLGTLTLVIGGARWVAAWKTVDNIAESVSAQSVVLEIAELSRHRLSPRDGHQSPFRVKCELVRYVEVWFVSNDGESTLNRVS